MQCTHDYSPHKSHLVKIQVALFASVSLCYFPPGFFSFKPVFLKTITVPKYESTLQLTTVISDLIPKQVFSELTFLSFEVSHIPLKSPMTTCTLAYSMAACLTSMKCMNCPFQRSHQFLKTCTES